MISFSCLEGGEELLDGYFERISMRRYDDYLLVDKADPLSRTYSPRVMETRISICLTDIPILRHL